MAPSERRMYVLVPKDSRRDYMFDLSLPDWLEHFDWIEFPEHVYDELRHGGHLETIYQRTGVIIDTHEEEHIDAAKLDAFDASVASFADAPALSDAARESLGHVRALTRRARERAVPLIFAF